MPWYTKLFLKKLEKLQDFSWETCEMMGKNLQKKILKTSGMMLKKNHQKSWNCYTENSSFLEMIRELERIYK